jgi:hypothetical protein
MRCGCRADTVAMDSPTPVPNKPRPTAARWGRVKHPKMKIILAVLVAFGLARVVTLAQQRQSTFRGIVYGVGSLTCDNWNTIKDTPPIAIHYTQLSWVEGFVTAVHNYTQNLKEVDRESIDPWISDYCEQHPTDSIVTAATSLALELADVKH